MQSAVLESRRFKEILSIVLIVSGSSGDFSQTGEEKTERSEALNAFVVSRCLVLLLKVREMLERESRIMYITK